MVLQRGHFHVHSLPAEFELCENAMVLSRKLLTIRAMSNAAITAWHLQVTSLGWKTILPTVLLE